MNICCPLYHDLWQNVVNSHKAVDIANAGSIAQPVASLDQDCRPAEQNQGHGCDNAECNGKRQIPDAEERMAESVDQIKQRIQV